MSENFVSRLGAAIDTMDADIFADCLTEDATFRFGNNAPVIGRQAIRDSVAGFFGTIRSIKHTPLRVHNNGSFVIAEMDCSYVDQWGRTLSVPVCNVLSLKGDKICEYFIYIDNHELFVAPSA